MAPSTDKSYLLGEKCSREAIQNERKTQRCYALLPQPLVRAVSLLLTVCILVADPSWAAGVSDLIRVSFSSDLRDITIPARLGSISDKWVPNKPGPFVVLIEDLHANIGVQKNIADIIKHLYDRFHIGMLYSEAAFGPCDVSLLRSVSGGRRQELVEKLLSHALLSGPELGAMEVGTGPLSPIRLEGVDDAPLYLANVAAFRDLTRVGPQAAREWRDLRDLLMPGAAPQLRSHLELVEKLLSLKLIDSDWIEYKEHRDLTPRGSPTFTQAIAAAERFYTAAEARNGAMSENLLNRLQSRPAILVTGGFHTASIAHVLKTSGVSFVVVSPHVDRLDQEDLYVRSLTEPPHETVAARVASEMRPMLAAGFNQLVARILDSREYVARKSAAHRIKLGTDMRAHRPWLADIVHAMGRAFARV